jgi:hypothetical protein
MTVSPLRSPGEPLIPWRALRHGLYRERAQKHPVSLSPFILEGDTQGSADPPP